jgi:serine/threonine protein kinase
VADLDPVAAFLSRGPMALAQSAKIVGKVCELLASLHETRRAHGAISPENVFFRHVGSELTVELRNVAAPSAFYATPERLQGRTAGPSTDVYSLGVLFFHMITGQPPFKGRTTEEIHQQHLTASPPGLLLNELQDIPAELEALVRAMMAKDPPRRPGVRKIATEIDNLDLDSTVMGVRIQQALDPEDLLRNVRIENDGRTDPAMIDPYADTLIKNRSELIGLDEVDLQDTYLSLPTFKKPTSGWNEDTKIIEKHHDDEVQAELDPALDPANEPVPDPTAPPAAESSAASRGLFYAGLVFFLIALATATVVMIRS